MCGFETHIKNEFVDISDKWTVGAVAPSLSLDVRVEAFNEALFYQRNTQ